jgi:hypothetical protein
VRDRKSRLTRGDKLFEIITDGSLTKYDYEKEKEVSVPKAELSSCKALWLPADNRTVHSRGWAVGTPIINEHSRR